ERRQREAEAEAAARQSQEQEIQRLLAEAKTAYARGSLVSPAGDNAADRYQQVLKLEAEQPDAIAGLQRIAYVLVEEAQHAQSVGDAESLRTLITQIASVQPDHPQLVPLQTALLQLAATPAELSRREATNLDRAAKYVAKSYEYLTRKPFDLRAADLATDQYDRAAQLAPMAPGLPSLRERLIAAYAEAVQTEIDAHDPRRALRMISLARKRNWMTPDLEQLEASIRQDAAGSAGSR
ncbi:MAG TPA: hypothetical protein VKB34_20550, partial [Povalibacter sp.]|nr:hypothetical protein [Povalibacter sp.]